PIEEEMAMRKWLRVAAVLGVLLFAGAARAETLTVFAAASLKGALDANVNAYQAKNGDRIVVSYAASSALAKQIEAGAPADLFISADLDWMDYIDQRKRVRSGTRINLLGNAIVLVAPTGSAKVAIAPGFPLAKLLGDGRLAMADPASVPAGKYGKAALETLGVWSSVAGRVAPAENVRAALLLVSRREAPYGIVYATDAAADSGVEVAGTFPADTHPPIIYPAAIVAASHNLAAAPYLAFLASPVARPLFEKQGFTVLK